MAKEEVIGEKQKCSANKSETKSVRIMATQQRDAFKEINFKFDDDPSVNTEVVIHRKQRRPAPTTTTTTTIEEEDFRRHCRQMNTSTPKKPNQSEVKLAMSSARSSFFGLDEEEEDDTAISNYDDAPRRDSQLDTAEMLENCTGEENYPTCDINNNNNSCSSGQEKRHSNKEAESGLGSISAASDEPDAKLSAEKELLLENQEEEKNVHNQSKRNIIREPQYYASNPNPSQTVYLATTVPQNLKGNKIMGRHTPTRSSLRHSRMLVISKDLRGALNPLNIFHPKWATAFLIINILLGLLITAIGLWILLWAPNTRIQDNPYWSGLVLILCGSMGVVVMEFKRIPRNLARERCFNWLRINLLVVLFLTLCITFAAFLFAAIHSLSLFAMNTVCIPASLFSKSASCVCIFDKPIVDMSELHVDEQFQRNNTELMDTEKIFLNVASESQFHYRDLNCNEVTGAFKLILLGSSLSNLIGFVATLGFLLLYYHGTRQVNLYATVRQPQQPQTITTGSAITTVIA